MCDTSTSTCAVHEDCTTGSAWARGSIEGGVGTGDGNEQQGRGAERHEARTYSYRRELYYIELERDSSLDRVRTVLDMYRV